MSQDNPARPACPKCGGNRSDYPNTERDCPECDGAGTAPTRPAPERMTNEEFEEAANILHDACPNGAEEPVIAEARRARESEDHYINEVCVDLLDRAESAEARVKVLEEQAPRDCYELLDKAEAERNDLIGRNLEIGQERDRLREALESRERALTDALNAECACGGRGPDDDGVCPVCLVWHRYRAVLAGEGKNE